MGSSSYGAGLPILCLRLMMKEWCDGFGLIGVALIETDEGELPQADGVGDGPPVAG